MACTTVTSCHEEGPIQVYQPGDEVKEADIKEYGVVSFFTCQPIPDSIFSLMQGRSFKEDSLMTRDSLRYLTCLHHNGNGRILVGEMVVNTRIADTVLEILRRLYTGAYPIERMRQIGRAHV